MRKKPVIRVRQLGIEGVAPKAQIEAPGGWGSMTSRERGDWLAGENRHYPYVDRGPLPPHLLYWIAGLLESHPFRFAKTKPENPHHYTTRREWGDVGSAVYNEVLTVIRDYGETQWFGGKPWRQLKVNGYYYWSWYAVCVEEVQVMNRKPVESAGTYDLMAEDYDSAFSDPESLAENEHVVYELIGDTTGLNLLDIGCGTGLFLDHNQHDPMLYTGIDPSGGMLNQLIAKHPDYAYRVRALPFEEYVGEQESFDLALCLFGTPAYIRKEYLEFIPELVKPGGRWIVMFLRDGYVPVAYERTGVALDYMGGVFADLPGTVTEYHNYVIVDGTR